jgi:hypothetical protein
MIFGSNNAQIFDSMYYSAEETFFPKEKAILLPTFLDRLKNLCLGPKSLNIPKE